VALKIRYGHADDQDTAAQLQEAARGALQPRRLSHSARLS